MKPVYGLQLYSVRDYVKEVGMAAAMRDVAALGYGAVEFAGFGELSAQEVRQVLDETGLIPYGTHTSLEQILPDVLPNTVADHKALGCTNLTVPWARTDTAADVDRLVEVLNAAKPVLDEAGISLHYHNHVVEFQPNQDGIVPEEELLKRTDVGFEIDVCWAFVAGQDPVAVMERFGKRVSLIHLKDALRSGEGRYLGQGEVGIQRIRDYALAHGIKMIVESEEQKPDGPTEVTACIRYLQSI